MKLNLIKSLNYVYLTFVILWQPFNLSFLNIDGQGRLMFLFTMLTFFFNANHDKSFLKKHLRSNPIFIWGVWILYSSINLLIMGYHGETPFIFFVMNYLLIPFFAMVIARKEIIRDKYKFLKLMSIVLVVFSLFSITTLSSSGAENTDLERSLGALGNMGPLTSLFIVFFFGLRYIIKKVNISILIAVIIFTVTIITMSGTRKAFGAVIIILIALVISRFKLNFRNVILILALSIGVNFGYNYVMENTFLGQRFEKGAKVGEERNTTDFEILNFLGDRASHYIEGWYLFLEHPINGVGIRNFIYVTNGHHVLHTEYIVQLAEGGIIGSIIFILFYFGIGKRILKTWRKHKNRRPEIWLLMGALGAILFIGLTAWTYSFAHYFIIIGIILGYLEVIKIESKIKTVNKKINE